MSKLHVYGALVMVQVLFGVHYFAAKLILETMTPRAWATIRVLGAATILMLYNVVVVRRHPASLADVGRLALFALFGVVCNQVLFVEGLSRTTPSHSSIINSLIPVVTLGIAMLLGMERPTRRHVLSIFVAFAAVLVLLRVESFRLEDQLVVGDLLTLANATSFSLFLVISRRYLQRTHPMMATAYLFVLGAIGIATLGVGPLQEVSFAALPSRFWWLAAYAILCATALTYFLNFYALRRVESSTVALFIYLQAPIATLLSMLFLGERPGPRFWIAAAGIFLGVYLAVRDGRTTRSKRVRATPEHDREA
ncbi:MAG: DMT family transporter [Candidatus Latescibacterota bacterium]|nr:MAG: DMT family transporter [Candidatus Latescibacterota bacterium]